MRNRVKTRSARKAERDPPMQVPRAPAPPPEVLDEDGLPTLEGFRPDERWMVRTYGD